MSATPLAIKKAPLSVGLLSLGCPKTLVDSELILGKLDPLRYRISPSVTDCDIALVNTCAFIKESQEESIDQILRLIELKKEGEIQKLIVVGCLVQRFPQALQKELGIKIYFAHAYHSWERGSNENTNGLIRRFFPKKTDFRNISDKEIRLVERLLNSRPRKRLGWKTPYQVFYELTGVALES